MPVHTFAIATIAGRQLSADEARILQAMATGVVVKLTVSRGTTRDDEGRLTSAADWYGLAPAVSIELARRDLLNTCLSNLERIGLIGDRCSPEAGAVQCEGD